MLSLTVYNYVYFMCLACVLYVFFSGQPEDIYESRGKFSLLKHTQNGMLSGFFEQLAGFVSICCLNVLHIFNSPNNNYGLFLSKE